jgi:RNA polymerase sigma-70 factor (ECF subfamily)
MRRDRFEAVAGQVYEPLQRYLRRRASADDAADVLSDTLLTLWRRLDDVPADAVVPWSYGVARRCLANHRRSAARHLRLTERVIAHRLPPDPDGPDGDPQRRVERLDPQLDAALVGLSEAERDIVHLWAWEQLEPREIAIALDLTPNAVSVALSRAKRKLADRLERPEDRREDRQDPSGAGQVPGGSAIEPGEETL